MSFIIMGRDECGDEFRVEGGFSTSDAAYDRLADAREQYPEARAIWVEELRDKDYYMRQRMMDDYFDERAMY